MPAKRWIPDTGPLNEAVEQVRVEYQKLVSEELHNSLEHQDLVVERLRTLEKTAATHTAQISKQLARNDSQVILGEVSELENAFNRIDSKIDECVDSILAIDDKLGPTDRLLAPKLPNKSRFPELHDVISEKSLAKTPSFLSVNSMGTATTGVHKDHASPKNI